LISRLLLVLPNLRSYIFACRYESIAETSGGEHGSPKIVTYREDARSTYTKPYLLLDMREKSSYERGHLLQARSFPCTLLRRDQIPSELYGFRNQPGYLIILYCDDEKESREAAKTFVDRGTLSL
jgi:rhodanese-related sulfurtransferase